MRKGNLGTSESFGCGWAADLFPHPCGLKNGKYIQDSAVFCTFGWGKISRRQLLPNESELPLIAAILMLALAVSGCASREGVFQLPGSGKS